MTLRFQLHHFPKQVLYTKDELVCQNHWRGAYVAALLPNVEEGGSDAGGG